MSVCYDAPSTPYQRGIDSGMLIDQKPAELAATFNATNQAELTLRIVEIQTCLIPLADGKSEVLSQSISQANLDEARDQPTRVRPMTEQHFVRELLFRRTNVLTMKVHAGGRAVNVVVLVSTGVNAGIEVPIVVKNSSRRETPRPLPYSMHAKSKCPKSTTQELREPTTNDSRHSRRETTLPS